MNPINIVLFSEVNSKFGYPFLRELMGDSRVNLLALVTSAPGKLCDYYLNESDFVDLEAEASSPGSTILVQGKLLVATSDGWVEIKTIRNEEGPVNFRSIPHQFDSAEVSSIVS